jgi:multicomponent Na+:H+ antiporter subunit D
MAEVSRSLTTHSPGTTFILIAFAFVSAGFLVKTAVVPFQFWLADAHAVAPTPVCVLFSGVMVELGLYAIARLYWLVFSPSLNPHADLAIQKVFLLMGCLTAVVGAVYCFGQRHLKRLLAFSTISHVGLMVIGFALLATHAFAGAAVYLVGHGLVKGALFLGAGMILHRRGSVDEYDLRGKAKNLKPLVLIFGLAALALLGLPPFATFFGESQIQSAAEQLHMEWLSPVTIIAEALTAAAVIRFSARIFFGIGRVQEATSRGSPHIPMDTETAGQHDKTPITMWLPAAVLIALAAIIAIPPAFRASTTSAAHRFQQPQTLIAITLDNAPIPPAPNDAPPPARFRLENAIAILIAFIAVSISLFPNLFGKRLNWLIAPRLTALMRPLRKLQSGNVGDYVTWFVFGIVFYCGLMILESR